MNTEDLIRLVTKLARTNEGFETIAWAINSAMREADELLSGADTGVGVSCVPIDVTKNRDLYPIPKPLIRISGVERMDLGAYYPLNIVAASRLDEASQRLARGGFAAIVDNDLRIHPMPSQDVQKGLRVWGYFEHKITIGGSAETEVVFPAHAQDFVIWSAAAALSEDKSAKGRAEQQKAEKKLTFQKLVEIPSSGPGFEIRREVP